VRRSIGRFLAVVLAVVACAELAARAIEARVETPQLLWYDESTQLKVEQMQLRGSTPMVVAGNSMAWQGLVPSVLDEGQAYNGGLAGGVPTIMEQWITGPVVGALQPSVVVWGLSSLDFSDVYGDAGLGVYQRAPASRRGLLAATDREMRKWSALIRQRPVLRNPSLLFGDEQELGAERFNNATRTLGADGERLDFEPAVTEDRAVEVRARISPFFVDRDDVAAIVRTIDSLRADGIDVVLVELPVPPRFLSLYDNGSVEHRSVGRLIRAIGAELDVAVIESGTSYTDADFVDFTHLNSSAATRFSTDVANELRRLGW
jgi:hypothetical protein